MRRNRPERIDLIDKELTRRIIGAFFRCYNELGYGFLESVYRKAMASELCLRGLTVIEECPVEVRYKGVEVGVFRTDLLVEHRIIVEAKATAALGPSDKRQLINYLRATGLKVGLLLHFGPEARFERCINTSMLYSAHPQQSAPDPGVSALSE